MRIASDFTAWVVGYTDLQYTELPNTKNAPYGVNGWLMHLGRNGEILSNRIYGGSGEEKFYGMSEIYNGTVWLNYFARSPPPLRWGMRAGT